MVDALLIRWHIPVPIKDFPKEDPYFPVKSDYTIGFKQKQVAAALIDRRTKREACEALIAALVNYKANKEKIVASYRKAQLDNKITTLLKNNFSREEVAEEIPKWDFPESLKKQAVTALLPKKVVLASKRVNLSNDASKQRQTRQAQALEAIARASSTEGVSREQALRLSALQAKHKRLASPWWIKREAQTNDPQHYRVMKDGHCIDADGEKCGYEDINYTKTEAEETAAKFGGKISYKDDDVHFKRKSIQVFARLEDGRVLEAIIDKKGEAKSKIYLDKNLKFAIKRAASIEEGWVIYLNERLGQKESMTGSDKEESGETNEEEKREGSHPFIDIGHIIYQYWSNGINTSGREDTIKSISYSYSIPYEEAEQVYDEADSQVNKEEEPDEDEDPNLREEQQDPRIEHQEDLNQLRGE